MHAGMGANLLYTPDHKILSSLWAAVPSYIPVTAKTHLLPDVNNMLKLIEQIIKTGISAITVHCQMKHMHKMEEAHVHCLAAIVDFVNHLNTGIPVIGNGDCISREDGLKLREHTGKRCCCIFSITQSNFLAGAHYVMIAMGAEWNLSCFMDGPLVDAETILVPMYFSLVCHWMYHPLAWCRWELCSLLKLPIFVVFTIQTQKYSIRGRHPEFYGFFGILFAFVHALEEEIQKVPGFCLPIFNLEISSSHRRIMTRKTYW